MPAKTLRSVRSREVRGSVAPCRARGGETTDPVTSEIILGAFETICYEMATHVSLTATTPILNQSNERNATILDARWQLAAVVVLCSVIYGCGAGEPMHDLEANGVLVEYRLQDSADGALLRPHLDAKGLLVPEVAAI